LAVWLFYFLVSLVLTYPLAFTYHRYPLFDHLEITVTFYNLWWQYYSLFHLKSSLWFNPLINYPDGYSMVFFPLFLSYGIFSTPIQALFSQEALIGFLHWLWILSFAFSGFLGFLLFRQLSGSGKAGIIAGICFSFLPFHYWHLPRLHISCLELLLLVVLSYFYFLKKRSLRAGAFFGLSLSALGYQSPNYVIYITFFLGLHFFYLLSFRREVLNRTWLKGIFLAGVIFLILLLPYLRAMVKDLLNQSTPVLSTLKEQSRLSANFLGFLLPGEGERFYQSLACLSQSWITTGIDGKEIFPGYLLLVSGILGMILARRYIKYYGFWLLAFWCFLIVSLGPYLNLARHTYHIVLPFYVLRKVFPFLEMERSPVRWAIISFLCLAVFSAGFFRYLEEKLSGKRNWIFWLFGLFALLELNQAPIKTDRINLPEFYQRLCSKKGEFSLLELPLLPDIYRYVGFYQIWHHKPLVIDLTARRVGAGLQDSSLLYYLDEPKRFFQLSERGKEKVLEEIQAEQKRRKVGYIILWIRFMEKEKAQRLDELIKLLSPVGIERVSNLFWIYQFKEAEDGKGGG